jgi:hypothetical protein
LPHDNEYVNPVSNVIPPYMELSIHWRSLTIESMLVFHLN